MFTNLVAEIAKKGLKKTEIASRLGMTPETLKNKLTGKTEFTLDEIKILLNIFSGYSMEYLFHKENK